MTTNSPAASAGKPPRWRSLITALLAAVAATAGVTAFSALTASASPAARTTAAAGTTAPKVSSLDTLHFSWGCTAAYSQTQIAFKANGTFVTTDGGNGKWAQVNGHLFWQYTNVAFRTTYSGTIDGNVGSGASSTFIGATGCWYLIAQGTTGASQHLTHHGHGPDSAGISH